MQHTRNTILSAVCLTILLFAGILIPGRIVSAKETKMKMPARIVVEYKDSETGKWKESYTLYFQYNSKGDMSRIDLSTPDEIGSSWIPTIIKYKYKKGIKASATASDSYGKYNYKFDKNGRLCSAKAVITAYDRDPKKAQTKTAEYTYDKNGNILTRKWSTSDPSDTVNNSVDKYTTSKKNGKITIKRKYTSTTGFDFIDTRKYNKNGLLVSEASDCPKESISLKTTYTYKMNKSGTVKTRYDNIDGTKIRRKYNYSAVKASREDYLALINLDERNIMKNSERIQN